MFQTDIGVENVHPQLLLMSKPRVEASRRQLLKSGEVSLGLLGRQSQRWRGLVCRQSGSGWREIPDLSEVKEKSETICYCLHLLLEEKYNRKVPPMSDSEFLPGPWPNLNF